MRQTNLNPHIDDDSSKGPNERPLLVTAKEAQAQLSVSRTALYLLINAGRLKTVKIGTGNRFRIPRAEIDRFVREGAA